LPTYQEMLFIK